MNALSELIRRFLLIEILQGLALTFRTMLKRPVTRRYPHERREPFPGFRGRHAFVRDPETGREKCVVCLKCATVCPSRCIRITYHEENGKRILDSYEIDALRCLFCAYCAEVCPVCALVLTEDYEYCGHSREEFLFNREKLLANWDEFIKTKYNKETYFNKFWRMPGIDIKRLPIGKRNQGEIKVR